ncbi:hypothetical protein Tco_0620280 [Tanacetum coccineum]
MVWIDLVGLPLASGLQSYKKLVVGGKQRVYGYDCDQIPKNVNNDSVRHLVGFARGDVLGEESDSWTPLKKARFRDEIRCLSNDCVIKIAWRKNLEDDAGGYS